MAKSYGSGSSFLTIITAPSLQPITSSGLFTYLTWFKTASFPSQGVFEFQGDYFGGLDLFAMGNLNAGPDAPFANYTSINIWQTGVMAFLCGELGFTGTAAPYGRLAKYGARSALVSNLPTAGGGGITGFIACKGAIVYCPFLAGYPRGSAPEPNQWHLLFVSADTTQNDVISDGAGPFNFLKKFNVLLDSQDVLGNLSPPTAQECSISQGYADPGGPSPQTFSMPAFSVLANGMTANDPSWNVDGWLQEAQQLERATTQIWFNKYVEPTPENLANIYRTDTEAGKIYAIGGKAAADAFGTPDIWFERDNVSGIEYGDNQGTAGVFEVVGTPPADFDPGPDEEGAVV